MMRLKRTRKKVLITIVLQGTICNSVVHTVVGEASRKHIIVSNVSPRKNDNKIIFNDLCNSIYTHDNTQDGQA